MRFFDALHSAVVLGSSTLVRGDVGPCTLNVSRDGGVHTITVTSTRTVIIEPQRPTPTIQTFIVPGYESLFGRQVEASSQTAPTLTPASPNIHLQDACGAIGSGANNGAPSTVTVTQTVDVTIIKPPVPTLTQSPTQSLVDTVGTVGPLIRQSELLAYPISLIQPPTITKPPAAYSMGPLERQSGLIASPTGPVQVPSVPGPAGDNGGQGGEQNSGSQGELVRPAGVGASNGDSGSQPQGGDAKPGAGALPAHHPGSPASGAGGSNPNGVAPGASGSRPEAGSNSPAGSNANPSALPQGADASYLPVAPGASALAPGASIVPGMSGSLGPFTGSQTLAITTRTRTATSSTSRYTGGAHRESRNLVGSALVGVAGAALAWL